MSGRASRNTSACQFKVYIPEGWFVPGDWARFTFADNLQMERLTSSPATGTDPRDGYFAEEAEREAS